MKYIVFICLIIFTTHLSADAKVPVVIGSDDDMDACMTLGLSVSEQNASVVRSGPISTSGQIDTLKNGRLIWMCRFKKDWVGVVYSTSDKMDCGVSRHINPAQPYKGPCKSGWMHKNNVEPAAG